MNRFGFHTPTYPEGRRSTSVAASGVGARAAGAASAILGDGVKWLAFPQPVMSAPTMTTAMVVVFMVSLGFRRARVAGWPRAYTEDRGTCRAPLPHPPRERKSLRLKVPQG